ncbi:MAG: FG-GAP-like repeat-containing protein, partial [Rhodothermales bacterium]|nr:FG-GAP-like repeat-containing protein [Rhodothermales bacterium]
LFVTNGYLRDYTNMDFLKYKAPAFFDEARKRGGDTGLHELVRQMPSTEVRNYAFRNDHDLTFSDRSREWGFGQPVMSNGAAYGDLDDDGDLDLVVNNVNEEAYLYRNNSSGRPDARYLRLRLKGPTLNPFGVGAQVTITTPDGNRQVQQLIPSRGYQSSVDPRLTFGIGSNRTADVEIVWPDGRKQQLDGIAAGTLLTLDHAAATGEASLRPPQTAQPLFAALPTAQGIDYVHEEDAFVDFRRDRLLPRMLSRSGPAAATGDVNRDGLADVYLGGARGQTGQLYIQNIDGSFSSVSVPAFESDAAYEDVDATFFDADGDGDSDLYVVSGGNDETSDLTIYHDRLYLNGGFGGFERADDAVPELPTSGSVVAPQDFDGDGDLDLFVGGRLVPGAYPLTPRSYLLQNEGAVFTDVTARLAPDLAGAGMVTDAAWGDVTGNGRSDLVVTGEWMPVKVFAWDATSATFEDATARAGTSEATGWWNCLALADLDGDGDIDIVAGNRGLNGQMRASARQPVTLYAADFDDNGVVDPVLTYFIMGKSYPAATRDELLGQINTLKKKFTSYESYSSATVQDIFTAQQLSDALKYRVTEFATSVFENRGDGRFVPTSLPNEAQFAPVQDIIVADFNRDGLKDLLIAGNDFGNRAEEGQFDAGRGLLMLGTGGLDFRPVLSRDSGFFAPWDVRELRVVNTRIGTLVLVVIYIAGVAAFGVLGPGSS